MSTGVNLPFCGEFGLSIIEESFCFIHGSDLRRFFPLNLVSENFVLSLKHVELPEPAESVFFFFKKNK